MHERGPHTLTGTALRGRYNESGGNAKWRYCGESLDGALPITTTGEGQLRLQKILLNPPPQKQHKFIKENENKPQTSISKEKNKKEPQKSIQHLQQINL